MAVEYAWSGAPTTTGFQVVVNSDVNDVSCRLGYSTDPALVGPSFTPVQTADDRGFVRFDLAGLTEDTDYYWQFEEAGSLTGPIGHSRTLAADGGFTAAFGSCAASDENPLVYEAIKDADPDFFIHLGDLHYENPNANDETLFRVAYRTVLTASHFAAMALHVPIVYTWSDHCYGSPSPDFPAENPGNSDGTGIAKEAAASAYRRCVPHYPLVESSGPIHHAFTVQRVRFIVPDSRYHRDRDLAVDTPTKTMLGAAQKAWLKQELTTSAADPDIDVIVLCLDNVWCITPDFVDSWGEFSYERTELSDHMVDSAANGKTFAICGDSHTSYIDDGRNGDYSTSGRLRLPTFLAGPLNQGPHDPPKCGPVQRGPFDASSGGALRGSAFGTVTFTPFTGGYNIMWRIINVDVDTGVATIFKEHSFDLPDHWARGGSTAAGAV